MGNRAVIVKASDMGKQSKCLYLHWNGGKASVKAFLQAAKHLGLDASSPDFLEELGHLVAGTFFGVELGQKNIYLQAYGRADKDNFDNGVFVIDDDAKIVDRIFQRILDEDDPEKTLEIAKHIVRTQNERQQKIAHLTDAIAKRITH